jgi:hypothetical protein
VSCFSLSFFRSPVWINSSIVSHVIFYYDNHPMTTSGIHVIMTASSWGICRILRRLFLMAFHGVRWTPSSIHLCRGLSPYSHRSNQW